MSVYLTKGKNLGEAERVATSTVKTGLYTAIYFLEDSTPTVLTVDGNALAGAYKAGDWVYGAITAVTGELNKDYILYKAQRDHTDTYPLGDQY